MSETEKPNCYGCAYRAEIPGNCHSRCLNPNARVEGNPHGVKSGWFIHPYNFDPVWLVSCDGYALKGSVTPEKWDDPFGDAISILGRRGITFFAGLGD